MQPFSPCRLESSLGPVQLCALNSVHLDEVDRLEQASSLHPWSRANIASSLNNSHKGLGLRLGEQLIAHAFISVASVEAELLLITVAKQHQGRGLGRLLLASVIEQLKGSAWELFLEVRPSNTAALALYESLGFNQLGVRPRYYPGPKGAEDAWVMGLSLVAD